MVPGQVQCYCPVRWDPASFALIDPVATGLSRGVFALYDPLASGLLLLVPDLTTWGFQDLATFTFVGAPQGASKGLQRLSGIAPTSRYLTPADIAANPIYAAVVQYPRDPSTNEPVPQTCLLFSRPGIKLPGEGPYGAPVTARFDMDLWVWRPDPQTTQVSP